MTEFILEVFSEEIPARMQSGAKLQLETKFIEALREAQLSYESLKAYATSRRLVVFISGLPHIQPDIIEEVKGPSIQAPPQALEGFMKSQGLSSLDSCQIREIGKASYYFLTKKRQGQETPSLLAQMISTILSSFSWPKSLRWANYDFTWVRPIHHIAAVFDAKVIPGQFHHFVFTNKSTGHRFMDPGEFEIKDFTSYKEQLFKQYVILDAAERRNRIIEQAEKIASVQRVYFNPDESLIEEVLGIVKWPVMCLGRIEPRFLAIPKEVLVTSMKVHQKYFPLYIDETQQKLAPYFLFAANLEASDMGQAITDGNQKVLKARLTDAEFFWNLDKRTRLDARVDLLDQILFHEKLGTMLEKANRLENCAEYLAQSCAAQEHINIQQIKRAGLLCKADLVSQMVGEFPEVQGIMGGYYATNDGEPGCIASAIRDHYKPQGSNDDLPSCLEAAIVSIADKIDSLVGFFAVDLKPTSSKDPFALRRSCLGILRIVSHFHLSFKMRDVVPYVVSLYQAQKILKTDPIQKSDVESSLIAFFADRLRVYLKDEGYRHDYIKAIVSNESLDDLNVVFEKMKALKLFFEQESNEGRVLLSLYKRANNILQIEEKKDKCSYGKSAQDIIVSAMKEPVENTLHDTLIKTQKSLDIALEQKDYQMAMGIIAQLSSPVNHFFDQVMVNVEDQEIRLNRLNILGQVRSVIGRVAEFSHIEE